MELVTGKLDSQTKELSINGHQNMMNLKLAQETIQLRLWN